MKIDVGCGEDKQAGYVGVDPFVPTDVQAFMWALPFPDGSVDEVYSSHALEHIAQALVLPTLREWRRVVKADGVVVIHVPCLLWVCENFLKNPVMGWRLATVFGAQTHAGEFHQTGFTREWMEAHYLPQAGLQLVKFEELWTHEQRTLSFECQRS